MNRLEELIKELPPEMQQEAVDFLEFLLQKRARLPQAPPKLAWRGALRHLRDRYTSVELQHKAQEWWGD
jgi:hypothetical protein